MTSEKINEKKGVLFMVNREEYDILKKQSKKKLITMSEYIRRAIRHYAESSNSPKNASTSEESS